jgi:hypothetical protein
VPQLNIHRPKVAAAMVQYSVAGNTTNSACRYSSCHPRLHLSLSLSLSLPSIHSSSTPTASRASFAYRRLHLIFLSSPCLPRCRPTKWLWLKTHPSSSHLLSRDFSSTVSHALTPSTTDLSLSHSHSLSRPPALHCWPTLASSASQLPGNCLVISHVSTLRRRLRRA